MYVLRVFNFIGNGTGLIYQMQPRECFNNCPNRSTNWLLKPLSTQSKRKSLDFIGKQSVPKLNERLNSFNSVNEASLNGSFVNILFWSPQLQLLYRLRLSEILQKQITSAVHTFFLRLTFNERELQDVFFLIQDKNWFL